TKINNSPSGRTDLPGQKELPIEPELPAAEFPGLPPSAVRQPEPVTAAAPEAVAATQAGEIPQVPASEPQPAAPPELDATAAFMRQIEAHKRAEELQRFLQTPEGQRELRIQNFKANGLSAGEEQMLRENPVMVDRPDVLHFAHNAAMQAGIERGSPEFLSAMKAVFEEAMKPQAPEPTVPAAEPEQATPAFFAPPAPPPPEPAGASFVSAPVSRSVPTSGGPQTDPSKVRLSPAERQIAQVSGLTDLQYAQQKMRLIQEKARGERQ